MVSYDKKPKTDEKINEMIYFRDLGRAIGCDVSRLEHFKIGMVFPPDNGVAPDLTTEQFFEKIHQTTLEEALALWNSLDHAHLAEYAGLNAMIIDYLYKSKELETNWNKTSQEDQRKTVAQIKFWKAIGFDVSRWENLRVMTD